MSSQKGVRNDPLLTCFWCPEDTEITELNSITSNK